MATLILLLVVFSALSGSTLSLQPQEYPCTSSFRCSNAEDAIYTLLDTHSVSAAHSLHSAVDTSWKVGIAFTHPSWIIEQGLVVTGVLYLLWFVACATCIVTFIFLSVVIARIQPYPPNRLLGKLVIITQLLNVNKRVDQIKINTVYWWIPGTVK